MAQYTLPAAPEHVPDLTPSPPWRDPGGALTLNWRHQRACWLLQLGRRPGRRDDAWTRLAWRYLRLVEKHGADLPRRYLRGPLGNLHHAHLTYVENGRTRWLVEAGLLTGEPLADTAARARLDEGVVDLFAKVYFCVGDRRSGRDYIALHALPRRGAIRADPRDTGGLLRLLAWHGGSVILDIGVRVLLGSQARTTTPASAEELRDALNDLGCRISLLLRCLPLHYFLGPRLVVLKEVCNAWSALQRELEALLARPTRPSLAPLVDQLQALDRAVRQSWDALGARAA
jgi:hypothetical protein